MRTRVVSGFVALFVTGVCQVASAQAPPAAQPRTESPTLKVEAPKALVDGPKAVGDAPKAVEKPKTEGLTATAAAGGMFVNGNATTTAITGSGAIDYKFSENSIGAQIVGNYAEGGKGSDTDTYLQTANIQGRGRYDRYLTDRLGAFMMYTHRYDQLQGYDARVNVDPGVKYLVLLEDKYQLGIEAGYDFQYENRRNKDRVVRDDKGIDTGGRLDKTQVDHAARIGAAYKHAFNTAVTLQANLEYIQSFSDTDRRRVNFNTLLAAKLIDGFSLGAGFTALYDHAPLAGKKDLDTTTTIQLIYAFSNVAKAPEPKTCPCPDETNPPPPPATYPPPPPPPAAYPPPPPPGAYPPPPPPSSAMPETAPTPAPAPAPAPAPTPAPAPAPAPN